MPPVGPFCEVRDPRELQTLGFYLTVVCYVYFYMIYDDTIHGKKLVSFIICDYALSCDEGLLISGGIIMTKKNKSILYIGEALIRFIIIVFRRPFDISDLILMAYQELGVHIDNREKKKIRSMLSIDSSENRAELKKYLEKVKGNRDSEEGIEENVFETVAADERENKNKFVMRALTAYSENRVDYDKFKDFIDTINDLSIIECDYLVDIANGVVRRNNGFFEENRKVVKLKDQYIMYVAEEDYGDMDGDESGHIGYELTEYGRDFIKYIIGDVTGDDHMVQIGLRMDGVSEDDLPVNINARGYADRIYLFGLDRAMESLFDLYASGLDFKPRYNNCATFVGFLNRNYAGGSELRNDADSFEKRHYFYQNLQKIEKLFCEILSRNHDTIDDISELQNDADAIEEILSHRDNSDCLDKSSINIILRIVERWWDVILGNHTYTYRLLSAFCRCFRWKEDRNKRVELIKLIREASREWN